MAWACLTASRDAGQRLLRQRDSSSRLDVHLLWVDGSLQRLHFGRSHMFGDELSNPYSHLFLSGEKRSCAGQILQREARLLL